VFRNKVPVDENGIPTLKDYDGKGQFDLGFDNSELVRFKGAIVK
jgi:hypothetical protein